MAAARAKGKLRGKTVYRTLQRDTATAEQDRRYFWLTAVGRVNARGCGPAGLA